MNHEYRQYNRLRLVSGIGVFVGVSTGLFIDDYELETETILWLCVVTAALFFGLLGEWQQRRKELEEASALPSFDDWLAAKRRERARPYDKDERDGGPIVNV